MNFFKNTAAIIIGCVLALLIAEGILKVYNPFDFRVRGDKIILPAKKKYIINANQDSSSHKFDDLIVHTKNSLGFRGEEPPEKFKDYLTIITIGGSTTECTFLSDDKTWTEVLGRKLKKKFNKFWINNAGFDGQSTFGHLVLMEDYVVKLRPDIILFLIGANDQGIEDFGEYDKEIMKDKFMFNSPKWFVKSMANHSEVFSLGVNLYRHWQAKMTGLDHRNIDFDSLVKANHNKAIKGRARERKEVPQTKDEESLMRYKKRLESLVRISRENNIEPVFITQPTLYGDFIHKGTMISHGKNLWESLELYNSITREAGIENSILVIDLAKEMPRDTKYYYDFYHFTNEGAEKIAEIIYNKLFPYLVQKYKQCSSDKGELILTK